MCCINTPARKFITFQLSAERVYSLLISISWFVKIKQCGCSNHTVFASYFVEVITPSWQHSRKFRTLATAVFGKCSLIPDPTIDRAISTITPFTGIPESKVWTRMYAKSFLETGFNKRNPCFSARYLPRNDFPAFPF